MKNNEMNKDTYSFIFPRNIFTVSFAGICAFGLFANGVDALFSVFKGIYNNIKNNLN